MRNPPHHARESWLGTALAACEARPPHPARVPAGTPAERALYAMRLVAADAEHGGSGLGRGAMRTSRRNWEAWVEELERRLAAKAEPVRTVTTHVE